MPSSPSFRPAFVDDALGRMRCEGDRCSALTGKVGVATACAIYPVRPLVCRECEPGDGACTMARVRIGLPPLDQRPE
jgi:Fe-S-cluster containining protein